jgi:bifunctional DNase/RNase
MEEMLEAEIWTVARTDQGNAVLLRPLGSDTVVPIFIGQLEAQSILIGFGDVQVKRPLTCDLFLELVYRISLTLFRIEVYEIRDNTFLARLFIAGKEFSEAKPLVLDSRPSDAFALAVRYKCPVFVSLRVVEQVGIPADLVIEDVAEFSKESEHPSSGRSILFPTGTNSPANRSGATGGMDCGAGSAAHQEGKSGAFPEGSRQQVSVDAKRQELQAELEQVVAAEEYERAAELRDLLILLEQEQTL